MSQVERFSIIVGMLSTILGIVTLGARSVWGFASAVERQTHATDANTRALGLLGADVAALEQRTASELAALTRRVEQIDQDGTSGVLLELATVQDKLDTLADRRQPGGRQRPPGSTERRRKHG